MFIFREYTDDQRKAYINIEHVYSTYVEIFHRYNKSFRYKMVWNKSNGKEYLYDTGKCISLGRRSEETELAKEKFQEKKLDLKTSLKKYKKLLEKHIRISKFEKVNRVPKVLANLYQSPLIIKSLNESIAL